MSIRENLKRECIKLRLAEKGAYDARRRISRKLTDDEFRECEIKVSETLLAEMKSRP